MMQQTFWIIPAFILLVIIIVFLWSRNSSKKLRSRIDSKFGSIPQHEDFDIETVTSYHCYASKENGSKELIDSNTWNDLNMDDVFKRIDNCQTKIGQEHLYHKLHEVCFEEEARAEYNDLLILFGEEKKRKEIMYCLARLGKSNYSISSLVFDPKQYKLKLPAVIYNLMAALAVILIIATIILYAMSLSFAYIFLIISFINITANAFLYYSVRLKMENQLNMLSYFSSVLWTCRKIIKQQNDYEGDYFRKLEIECAKLDFIRSRISSKAMSAASELDYIKEFLYMIFLIDIRKYNKSIKKIQENKESVKQIYKCFGEIDAAINTLSFMSSLKSCCLPDFCDENRIEFEEVYHPLITEPVTNSGILERNILITGANASGKSTFIKAIAVNNILALSLGVCCAKSYRLKRSLTITSMAQRDDIIKGESYYIAELKSLKRILDKIEEVSCTCFVDEILKGTNTTERIAASISVMEYMTGKDCFCLIATHDTQIAQALDGKFINYHFEEKINDNDIEFDYIFKKGIAKGKNAVKLLGFFDYPKCILNEANKRVDEIEKSQG